MATGDQSDMLNRLREAMPRRWFPTNAPVLDAILTGFASVAASVFDLAIFAKAQARLKTATDAFLDVISMDFFGAHLPRRRGEADEKFRRRILSELFRERATRRGVVRAVEELTNQPATIIELWNPGDCGAYDVAESAGYDVAGLLGSYDDGPQFLVRAKMAAGFGVPNVAGFDDSEGGYDAGGTEYIDPADLQGDVPPAEIYATVDRTRAAGVTAWVQISP